MLARLLTEKIARIWKQTAIAVARQGRLLGTLGRSQAERAIVGTTHFVSSYLWVPIATSTGLGVYDSNLVYRQFGHRIRNPIRRYLLCAAVFVLPLVMVCAWRNVLISETDIEQLTSLFGLPGTDVRRAVSAVTQPRQTLSLYSDVWFAIVIFGIMPIHSVVVLEIWDTIERAAAQMKTDGLVTFSEDEYSLQLERHRKLFNNRAFHLLAYLGALTLTALMLLNARHGTQWWGDFSDPISFVTLTAVLVAAWHQLLWHNFKGLAALRVLRTWLSNTTLRLDVFHPDGAFGLRLIARTLTLSMLTTALHAFAVLCLVRAGFITGGINVMTVVLAMFFVVFFPAFAAYPVFILWRRSRAFKRQSYAVISLRMRAARLHALSHDESGLTPEVISLALLALEVNRLPTHPFRRTATTALILGYALQIASALLTLLPVTAGSSAFR